MLTPENAATDGLESTDLAERLRAATAFLELIAANRGLLAEVPGGRPAPLPRCRRARLQSRRQGAPQAGQGHDPPPEGGAGEARRVGAQRNGHPAAPEADGLHHAERVPSPGILAGGRGGRSRLPRGGGTAVLLRLQAALHGDPSVLRPALSRLRRVQLLQAHRAGRPARPGGAAHRRTGEDRIPGGAQAAAGRGAPARHHALPARLGDALCRRAGLRGVERPTGDLRARPAAHAECGGVLPPAGRRARPARLHHQQCVPDGAAPAGVLPAHDGAGDGIGGAAARAGATAPGRVRGMARRSTCCRRATWRTSVPTAASRARWA